MNVAFVLLTYRSDEPAGVERSVAALAAGLRALGHRATVLTAAPDAVSATPDLIRLASVTLPHPATEEDLLAAVQASSPGLAAEVRNALNNLGVDLVCWVDAAWGLGFLAPAPPGVATVLMVHVPRADPPLRQALDHRPGRIVVPSLFVPDEVARSGVDTRGWTVVSNGLLRAATPPSQEEREALRRDGPVRILARAEPHKGVAELIDAFPDGLRRPVEIVLAPASFEYWPGMQDQVVADCRARAARHPTISLRGPLPWDRAQEFLAAAACTLIPSTSPETFGLVALEAMSAGTPVVAFDLGHVPRLVGPAGSTVPLAHGAGALWDAASRLLRDPDLYGRRSMVGISRSGNYTPNAVAADFLAAVAPAISMNVQPDCRDAS